MVSQVVVGPWKYDSLPTDIEGRNIPDSFSGFSMRAPCIGRQFFSVTVFPLIVLAYVLLARREERRVIERFGDEYLAYRRRVPMVFRRSC